MIQVGDRFTKLTVMYETNKRTKSRGRIWHCKCDCGNELDVPGASLVTKNTQSCGCLIAENAKKHGEQVRILNKYDLSGEYGIGYTSKGEEFYFDLEDYDKIKKYTWGLNELKYVVSAPFGKSTRMHILIMNPPKGMVVDHINHMTYDNRKENLRICERSQNQMNQKLRSDNTSGRKGVYFDKSRNKWMASIAFGGRTKYLGRFDNKEDAIRAREEAEEKYFGEYNYNKEMDVVNI